MMNELILSPGAVVVVRGRLCRIAHLLDLETVVVVDEETGERRIEGIAQCEPPPSEDEVHAAVVDLHEVTEVQWQKARERAEAIKAMLGPTVRTVESVREVARKQGVSLSTIYRWIKRFGRTGTLVSLVPERPNGGGGKTRISRDAEEVIQKYIRERYLTRQKPSASVIIEDVQRACRRAGIRVPHGNTIRRRIKRIPGRIVAKDRGDRRALEAHTPTPGRYPDADYPLDVYQIDHTPIDAEIVDDRHRLPIGRPWLTVVIDCYSRMVAGFAVLLEPPSALSVGLALSHAILPKDEWLARRDIDYSWPVFGRPKIVHADNGADFRCEAVTKGCQNNGIDIAWRPVKKPNWGGHIERLLGSLNSKLKELPGATFSNPAERGGYNSSKEACLTLSELEAWLAEEILGKYHNGLHRGIGTTPLRHFEEGIHGTADRPGRGLPSRPLDSRRLLIDFLPFEYRTVQPTGITLDNVRYYAPELARWVGAQDDNGGKRRFRVHRDPRAISPVFFFDPDQRQYVDVPYADLSLPVISLPELRAAQRELAKRGRGAVDEEAIFRAADKMRRIESEAAEKTRAARRNQQRRMSRRDSLQATPAASPMHHLRHADAVVAPPSTSDVPVTAYEIEDIE